MYFVDCLKGGNAVKTLWIMGENLCLENHNIIVPSDENHKITH